MVEQKARFVGAGRSSRVHAASSIAALALLVVGCSEPAPFHADVRFTVEEREEIQQGAAFLSVHTGRPVRIVFDLEQPTCADGHILRVEYGGGQATNHCISLGRVGYPYSALAAHELAHWLGLMHVNRPGALMYSLLPTLSWTAEDEAECRRVGACDES